MKVCQFKGYTPKLKKTKWFLFWFFPGGDWPSPGFSWFSPRKSLQNRQNVWSSHCDGIWPITLRVCTHIFTSLVNVRRKHQSIWSTACQSTEANIRLCFRLFDSSKYLTTLRSNISRCQKATTLILITLYNPSFHLWKSSKKSLGTTVFLSWMPFKICDCDKFLSTTPVTQFLL